MLQIICAFFKSCWVNLREFLGVDDGAKKRWNPIFEIKALEGNIGFLVRWPTIFQKQIIWETEALIRELSDRDTAPVVFDEMERLTNMTSHDTPLPYCLFPKQHKSKVSDQNLQTKMLASNCDLDSTSEHIDTCNAQLACSLPSETRMMATDHVTQMDQMRCRRCQRSVELESHDINLKSLCDNKAKLFYDDTHLMFKLHCKENKALCCEHNETNTSDRISRGVTTLIKNTSFQPKLFDENYLEAFKKGWHGQNSSYENLQTSKLQADNKLSSRTIRPKMELPDMKKFSLTDALNVSHNYSQEKKSLYDSSNNPTRVKENINQPTVYNLTKKERSMGSDVDDSSDKANTKDITRTESRHVKINPVVDTREAESRFFLLSSLLTQLQTIVSFIVRQFLLCKRLVATPWRKRNAKTSAPALEDDPFVSRTSAKNPFYYATPKPSKIECGKPAIKQTQFLEGKEAYDYYKHLITAEKNFNLQRLELDWKQLNELYTIKKKLLSQFVSIAKEYYRDPTEDKRRQWIKLKKGIEETTPSFTDVYRHVSVVRNRIPFFSVSLILIQVIILIVLCVRFGLDEIAFESYKKTQVNIPTFLGSEAFTVVEEPSPLISPPERAFWVAGAAVARCFGGKSGPANRLRDNIVPRNGSRTRGRPKTRLGCCEMGSHFNRAGTTTLSQCKKATTGIGTWQGDVFCSRRTAPNNHVAHVIKPCCEAVTDKCRMLSHEHCVFIRGVFHIGLDHCRQANCLRSMCRLTNDANAVLPEDVNSLHLSWRAWLPWGSDTKEDTGAAKDATSNMDMDATVVTEEPRQWWRLITALPFTVGVLHLLLVVAVEASLMLPVEICAGWHRVLIIFVCSALAGEMIACSVEPSRPHDGSTGGASGFLGVAYLELLQAWPFLPRPWCEAAKLVVITLLFLALGTLQMVSLAAILTGLLIGATLCLMLVPYITFGRRLGYSRLRVVLLGFVLFVVATVSIHFYFISTLFPQSSSSASQSASGLYRLIKYLECVKYTDHICVTYPPG